MRKPATSKSRQGSPWRPWVICSGLVAVALLAFLGRDFLLRQGRTVQCPEGSRQTIDIRDFVVQYSAYSATFEAKLEKRGEFSAKLDPVQLTALNEAAQQAAEFRKLLVAGYNSCAISGSQFAAAGVRFQALDGLARQIDQLARQPNPAAEDRSRLTTLVQEYLAQARSLAQP